MIYRLYNADTLNRYAKDCHERAVDKGFWDGTHSVGHYLMLAFGELHETIEADRIGKWAKLDPDTIDTLQRIEGAIYVQEFLRLVEGTVGCEIADAVIRLLDLLGWMLKDRALSEKEVETDLGVSAFYIAGEMTLAEALWPILQEACCHCGKYAHRYAILYTIKSLELLCERLGIDLMTHIELKTKYNELRPALHGKKY
nr:MAG TPA: NTP-PPase-like protein [Caudoviricetes sp.]